MNKLNELKYLIERNLKNAMSDIKKVELYNTLTRKKEELKTLEPGKVKMYTCGITVYSHPQIGNWVAYIYSDVLTRTLIAAGYEVERVQNITDVGHLVSDDDAGEDKMEKGAKAEGLTAWDVADKYIKIADNEGYEKLRLLKPKLVRATDLIKEQIEFVEELEKKGVTYVIEGEGVYFDTSKLDDYGKLARLDIGGLEAGVRVDVGGKNNITDFALWKFSPKDQKRDMEWDSPWSKGFPGWHLECSTIARENLGDQIDLHTGGIDHIPVHHTNEIAQTETLTGKKPFSGLWFHNNFMKVDGAKLSKSLNNSYTLEDITKRGFSLDAFKLLVLSSHYRTEGNFTWEILEAAQNRLRNWQSIIDLSWQPVQGTGSEPMSGATFEEMLLEILSNDLDTPKALAFIDKTLEEFSKTNFCDICLHSIAMVIGEVLGVVLNIEDISDDQKELLKQRQQARDSRNFVESDRIRDELMAQGIAIRDDALGQIWSRA